jgi:hypothetical protein
MNERLAPMNERLAPMNERASHYSGSNAEMKQLLR